MTVVTDLVGDEDDTVIAVEYLKQYLQESIYQSLLNLKPITYDAATEVLQAQYRKVLLDAYPKEGYDPQVKCVLQEDGKVNVTFLCPQWMADRINEDD